VRQYGVGTDGSLDALSPASVATGTNASSITLSPDGKHAYATNFNASTVSQYGAGTGKLAPLATPTAGTGLGPRDMAFTPDGKFAYVTNQGNGTTAGTVSMYSVATNGQLTLLGIVNAGLQAWGIKVSPDGKAVFVANMNNHSVSQYDIGTDGRLTPMATATVQTGSGPRGMAFTPDGKYLYVTNLSDSTITQFEVKSTGLEALTTKPMSSLIAGPWAIAIH